MVYNFSDNPHPAGCLPSRQLVPTAALLIPWGLQGRRERAKAAKDAALSQGMPRKYGNSWILPLSYCHGGSGHTCMQQRELRLLLSPTDLKTNLSRMILFTPKCSINHLNPKYHTCWLTI